MNLLNKKWINKDKLDVQYLDKKIIIENSSENHKFLVYPHIFKSKNSKELFFNIKGNLLKGTGCTLRILNRHKTILGQCGLNSCWGNKFNSLKYYILILYVPAKSKIEITKLDHEFQIPAGLFDNFFNNDTLLITPGYPSLENKYNTAFVHTRVKAYKEAGLDLDVALINSLPETQIYEFEDIKIYKGTYSSLRELLQKKKYKRILVHFFDYNYANVFDSIDLTETSLFFYMHGADILYRDYPLYASHYFEEKLDVSDRQDEFKMRDLCFKKYNSYNNVTWMFVSEFVKNRAEELLNITFNNYKIIPCYIDNNLFKYENKNPDLRKKIFILRRFTNDSCYALDIDIRVILELSNREFFNDLTFDIYGDGEMFDILTEPVKNFNNVNLHRMFLTHEDIYKVHQSHGIGLFASRFDTQGVSLCEAISSGCAVVTSNIPVIASYIPNTLGVTCNVENYREYADVIEKMYYDKEYFSYISKMQNNSINEKFNYANTIDKEMKIFDSVTQPKHSFSEQVDEPILTVIVPAYNVDNYLRHGVMTLLNQPYSNKLEILIVNDGSKDNTAKIGKELQDLTTVNGKSIVRLIDKENGGHGSTINVGIREAKGKYLKVMDGDDTVDSQNFYELIKILENEDTDIILNNYYEDFAPTNTLTPQDVYPFMVPYFKYNFDELCYNNYGFSKWGPILSCSTYKTQMLKNANFKLSEHCFYVDMELNTYISIACKTIKYYPIYIYRYYLGRENQSVTKESYMKNYKHHEKVIMNIINILSENSNNISELRKNYIINKLILVMIKSQYIVCLEFYRKPRPFREFEKKLKKYPEFYNSKEIVTTAIKFHRLTHGCFIRFNSILVRIKSLLKKILKLLKR